MTQRYAMPGASILAAVVRGRERVLGSARQCQSAGCKKCVATNNVRSNIELRTLPAAVGWVWTSHKCWCLGREDCLHMYTFCFVLGRHSHTQSLCRTYAFRSPALNWKPQVSQGEITTAASRYNGKNSQPPCLG
jgi:hypothetical protein